ncbi:ribosome small subunit-dependent GTPase A [Kordia sp.]|uniref:ribosome small subunit-dependent GTPase A n=1 Tax=Kordia sp. TaxID=1965332 RepID=UPI003D6B52CC
MKLEDLGYTKALAEYRKEKDIESFGVGRVILEHKDRYVVKTEHKEFNAEIIGNLRYNARSKHDLPAVGDWVAISEYDTDKVLIHAVYSRHSILERQAVGKSTQTQIIATNIDYALIVQSVNRDFSINRLERYLTICNTSNVEPIIILSKIDLIDKQIFNELIKEVKDRIKDVSIIAISNQTQFGINELESKMIKGKTYCLLGSSGVGKSTLINSLIGGNVMNTGEISQRIDRGKHVTTHRELIVLKNGVLIDNPGMREVGITDTSDGLESTFDAIVALAQTCKFSNCTHTNEKGCEVQNALENGEIDSDSYANFLKLEKESAFFELSAEEKRKKDKNLGKMIRNVQKQRKRNKY